MNIIKRIIIGTLISVMILITGCVIEIHDNKTRNGESPADSSQNTVGKLKIHFIDVGQADSILIQCGSENILIDAGNNDDRDMVADYIKSQGVNRLDYVVGTHPHEDHIGGLDRVIESFDIGKVYMPKASSNTKTYKDVLEAIKAKGLKITNPVPGSNLKLGDASVDIFAPNSTKYEDVNNYSIVMKLKYGNTSYLFMGDAEVVSEDEIINKGFDVTADLIKIGHHGSNSSTSELFLDRVEPDYAVIFVGIGNDYGHPTKTTMDKLKKRNIPVYRTDENGTIVVTSDGDKITFNTKPGSYVCAE